MGADYGNAPGMPPIALIRELSRFIERGIRGAFTWSDVRTNDALLRRLSTACGRRAIHISAQPYKSGAGLGLRGFFCKVDSGDNSKFVIFLNSAHPAPIMASTFGHELGHYLYDSLVQDNTDFKAFVEGNLSQHLSDQAELFADCLVSLTAYDRSLISRIVDHSGKTEFERWFSIFRKVQRINELRCHMKLGSREFSQINRLSYLTGMIHFLKLRCALFKTVGL